MQEMERLWRHGEQMYDAFWKEDFICRAIIFVTTNDYPTLFALSGQIKGKTGCLVCLDGTTWVYLDASKKIVYLRNWRFLKTSHKYRSKHVYTCNTQILETGTYYYCNMVGLLLKHLKQALNTLWNEEMTKIKVGDLDELYTFIFITFTAEII